MISNLYAGGEVAVHEEGLGDDVAGSLLADPRFREVSAHLVDQQMALRFLELVEDHDALLPIIVVLQEVEESLEQIGVVLPQTATARGTGIGLDNTGRTRGSRAARRY